MSYDSAIAAFYMVAEKPARSMDGSSNDSELIVEMIVGGSSKSSDAFVAL